MSAACNSAAVVEACRQACAMAEPADPLTTIAWTVVGLAGLALCAFATHRLLR